MMMRKTDFKYKFVTFQWLVDSFLHEKVMPVDKYVPSFEKKKIEVSDVN